MKMRELCNNFPVHRVKHFETNGDEEISTEAIKEYLNSQLLPRRRKRDLCDMTVWDGLCDSIRSIKHLSFLPVGSSEEGPMFGLQRLLVRNL